MKHRSIRPQLPVLLFALFILSGCGGGLQVQKIQPTENPTDLMRKLDQEMDKARQDKVNVLSPRWFARAERSHAEAKELQKRGRSLDTIFREIAECQAELNRANESAKLAKTVVPDAIKARDEAREAGATAFESEYRDVEEKFIDLTRSVEEQNVRTAKKRQHAVARAYRALELKAIKKKTLGDVRKLIQQAKEELAERYSPKTLASAEKKLRNTDTFISQHHNDKSQVNERAQDALFEANRLIHLNRESLMLQRRSTESIALWMEETLAKIVLALNATDMRNQAFNTQVENILQSVEQLDKDREFLTERGTSLQQTIDQLKKKVAELEGKTKTEQEAIARLEAERRFQESFSEVRTFFEPHEAEVYKQGDRLIIRLRAIQFPVGQYVIMPQNYALLTRVQRAIRTFGSPQVIIEGHTDSTGSDTMNEVLSQQRAEAVREYFLANHTLPAERIGAVGYGASRPIASNRSSDGRAANRRIDVVILPRTGKPAPKK